MENETNKDPRSHAADLAAVAKRFLRYVKIDTQSSDDADRTPSTEKQKELGNLLVAELGALGLRDAAMDEWGIVTATLPAVQAPPNAPTIGLIAHVDTSPEVSGHDVKPRIHRNYGGERIDFPACKGLFLDPAEDFHLAAARGKDIITADGSTLLGADDKAGIAEIMTALEWFGQNPDVAHGPVRVAFTCDEEVGRGTDKFDVNAFGADYAYTVDGEAAGEIEDETFCADRATVTFFGKNVHPGYGKGKLVNSMRAAGRFVDSLDRDRAPETTAERQGYLHPIGLSGDVERTTIRLIVRDFEEEGLQNLEKILTVRAEQAAAAYRGVRHEVRIETQYRNMKYRLDAEPRVTELALEAVRRAGGTPHRAAIRGGTDGARLSYKGLLTPNIFTGGHNFHSRTEWIAIQDMELAVRTLVELIQLWTTERKPKKTQ